MFTNTGLMNYYMISWSPFQQQIWGTYAPPYSDQQGNCFLQNLHYSPTPPILPSSLPSQSELKIISKNDKKVDCEVFMTLQLSINSLPFFPVLFHQMQPKDSTEKMQNNSFFLLTDLISGWVIFGLRALLFIDKRTTDFLNIFKHSDFDQFFNTF